MLDKADRILLLTGLFRNEKESCDTIDNNMNSSDKNETAIELSRDLTSTNHFFPSTFNATDLIKNRNTDRDGDNDVRLCHTSSFNSAEESSTAISDVSTNKEENPKTTPEILKEVESAKTPSKSFRSFRNVAKNVLNKTAKEENSISELSSDTKLYTELEATTRARSAASLNDENRSSPSPTCCVDPYGGSSILSSPSPTMCSRKELLPLPGMKSSRTSGSGRNPFRSSQMTSSNRPTANRWKTAVSNLKNQISIIRALLRRSALRVPGSAPGQHSFEETSRRW